MNNYIKALLYSVVVGIFFTIYVVLQPIPCDVLLGLAQGILLLKFEVLISVFLGVLGFLWGTPADTSSGKKFMSAISWFGISLITIFLISSLGATLADSSRKAEWNKECSNQDRLAPDFRTNKY